MVYKFKTGYFGKVPAQVAGEELARLNEQGIKTPRGVLDASRDEDAPLHPVFEWDDSIAAEAYREEQARCLIKSIEIVVGHSDSEMQLPRPVEVRAFYNIERGTKEYEPTIHIMSDDEKKQKLLEQAIRELQWFKNKYAMLNNELGNVFDAIDSILPDGEGEES